METYLLLSLLFMYHLIRSLHYSYLRNLFAQTLKASLSLSLSVCISFYQAPELTCDVEKFMGAPNAPASHAFIKDRLIPSRVVHSHDASNGLTWRIFHRDLCTSSSIACCNQQSTLRLHASLLYRTSCGLITIYPRPQDHPLGEFICGFIYSPPKKNKKKHTRWCHSAVPALFIGNVEFFSATTLTQGISSALISTADKQDVHGWYVEMTTSIFPSAGFGDAVCRLFWEVGGGDCTCMYVRQGLISRV